MKKGCLIAIGAVVGAVVLIVALVFGLTSGVVKGADEFLALLGGGRMAEAYQSASPSLRAQQSQEVFDKTVKDLGLTDFASASWSNREMNNDRGHVEGTVTTKSHGSIPLRIDLMKEGGNWKVYSLSAPKAGASVAGGSRAVPPEAELKTLALESLLAFNKAVQAKSFAEFHQGISILWQKQVTPEKLTEIFRAFIEQEIDIATVRNMTPAFEPPPSIDSNGVLVVSGSYPTEPSKLKFTLKYVDENSAWKLVGINVNIK
jgi:hypothetical protein